MTQLLQENQEMDIESGIAFRKDLYHMIGKRAPKSTPTRAECLRCLHITRFVEDNICETSFCKRQFVRLALEGADDHPFEATIAKMNCPEFCMRCK